MSPVLVLLGTALNGSDTSAPRAFPSKQLSVFLHYDLPRRHLLQVCLPHHRFSFCWFTAVNRSGVSILPSTPSAGLVANPPVLVLLEYSSKYE